MTRVNYSANMYWIFNCLALTFIILVREECLAGMTKAQLKKAGQIMKNVCMPKNQVTEDDVGDIDKGKFIEDQKVMCYIACIYQMSQSIKNGKLNSDAALKQIDLMFPDEVKDQTKKSVLACKDIGPKFKDICQASYFTAKCMYEFDPSIFFFP